MRLQVKLIILLFISLFLFMGLSVFRHYMEKDRLCLLFDVERKEKGTVFNGITRLASESLKNFADDYSFWDEMVDFITSGDKEWAVLNIDTSLKTFRANAVWIYRLDGSLVYSVNNLDEPALKILNLPAGSFDKLFAKSRFCDFFIETPRGMMEVRGATVHPTLDTKRESAPKGYFFAGRLWNENYIETLSTLTQSEIMVKFMKEECEVSELEKGIIVSSMLLRAWDGKPLACVDAKTLSNSIINFNKGSKKIFRGLMVYFCLFFGMFSAFLIRWVNIPMGKIGKSLETGNPLYVNDLRNRKDEFGKTAELIHRFFEQRQRLVNEIAEHKKAEKDLRSSEEKFLKAFQLNPSMMAISVPENGRLVEVNDIFKQVTGYSREELIGHTTLELGILTPEARSKMADVLKQEGIVRNMEVEIFTKTGERRICLISLERILIDEEQLLLSVSNDITWRKQAEDELKKRMDELERFNKVTVGRELKMVELKERIKELEEKLAKRG